MHSGALIVAFGRRISSWRFNPQKSENKQTSKHVNRVVVTLWLSFFSRGLSHVGVIKALEEAGWIMFIFSAALFIMLR